MGLSSQDGPIYIYGNMAAMSLAAFGSVVGDGNTDAGPSAEFQGDGILDPRYWFIKDQLQGYIGKQPVHFNMPYLRSVSQIPAAFGGARIAALQNAASGTAFTLAVASVGFTPNIPIAPYSMGAISGLAPVTVAALDYGFAFGTVTSGSKTITVANAYDFSVGMPLVITGVGNSGGTAALLTNVASITDTTHIVVADTPAASLNPAAIGTGNLWGPSPVWDSAQNYTPTGALPWLGGGPALLLDPRQAVARGVSITGVASGTGGNFVVRGYDIYHVPMSETIAAGAGVSTVYGLKAFKYITSVTPAFSDAHNYSIGTSDVFGFHYRAALWDDTDLTYNNGYVNTATGFTAPLALITAATATNADVRGTIQVSNQGGGAAITGGTNSTGTVSALAMTGVRLGIAQTIAMPAAISAFPAPATIASAVNVPNAASVFGNAQFTS